MFLFDQVEGCRIETLCRLVLYLFLLAYTVGDLRLTISNIIVELLITERDGLLFNQNYCLLNVERSDVQDFVFSEERFAMALVLKAVDGSDSFFLQYYELLDLCFTFCTSGHYSKSYVGCEKRMVCLKSRVFVSQSSFKHIRPAVINIQCRQNTNKISICPKLNALSEVSDHIFEQCTVFLNAGWVKPFQLVQARKNNCLTISEKINFWCVIINLYVTKAILQRTHENQITF